jgi:hypothetical protein
MEAAAIILATEDAKVPSAISILPTNNDEVKILQLQSKI